MTITCKLCGGRCLLHQHDELWRPRIGIAGLSCETSTFTHARTDVSGFHPLRGTDVINEHAFLAAGSHLGDSADWEGALTAYALPGGMVTREAFEELSAEIVNRLERIVSDGPLDGLWFDIHGAMSVEDLDDCEAELLRRIRRVVGTGVAVSASMDLHGNVSRDLVEQADLITCYRSAPHEDVVETKQRACRNLLELLQDRHRHELDCGIVAPWPVKAWIAIPVLLPGEQTSTRLEPAKRIYASVSEVESRNGIIDASIWVGYAWADEPRSHASVVVTGWTTSAVREGAEQLAKMFWNAREEFHFAAPTASFNEALDKALDLPSRPYFISDSGDNPTAGGSGDMTWTLRRLIACLGRRATAIEEKGLKIVYAAVPSPSAIAAAIDAGIGSRVTVTLDSGIDDPFTDSMDICGSISAIKRGDGDAETEVVVKLVESPIHVILTKFRKPYHYEHDFTDLNLDIGGSDERAIVIVKIGYLEPELFKLAQGWTLALTPGGVDQHLPRLGHKRISRPMWPFDRAFPEEPDLRARTIGRARGQ